MTELRRVLLVLAIGAQGCAGETSVRPDAESGARDARVDGSTREAGLLDSAPSPRSESQGAKPCSCLLGDGPYCGARAAEEAARAGCTIGVLAGHESDLLSCEDGSWSVLEACKGTCTFTSGSGKLDDACQLPVCDCFVQVAWCGSGAAKEAASRGCKIPLLPAHNGDILHCPGGQGAVKESCANGCVEAPKGTPDSCKTSSEYLLPFDCGTTRTCSNGNHTSTHTGKDEYAYDFAMPVGTTLRAMRGGKVLRVRMVSKPGDPCYNGGGTSCANYANTVEVQHPDGTVALYMHLSTGSVSTGQTVKQGQVIGKSGNSGWSTGPHLHCQVQSSCGSWWCQSLPFVFGDAPALKTGVAATSKNCP